MHKTRKEDNMEVGDYCYIKGISRDYGIGKITQLNSGYSSNGGELIDIQFKHSKHSVPKKDVISSPNIMDLIEEGDILKVNDFKDVYTIYEVEMFRNPYTNEKYLGIRNDLGSKPKRLYEIPLVNLSIVTHEQFESMQYNLESEVN